MGLTKRYMEEEEARAYYTSDDSVCARCFDDPGIKAFICEHVSEHECSVCGRKSKKLIAASADKVLEFIFHKLHRHYQDAYGNAPYDNETGDYALTTWDTVELLYEVLEDAAPFETLEWVEQHAKGDVTYCRRDWQIMSPGEALASGWERFSQEVREKTRFMFFDEETDDGGEPFLVRPGQMLEELGEAIRRCELLTTVKTGTRIFRVRAHKAGKSYTTGPELGPPPTALARTSGRMNAPGIVVAYAAFEGETALAEATGKDRECSLGEFELLQDVRVVDLTEVPDVPSIFENGPRESLQFLNRFAQDVSQPFQPDDEAHVEYTPTQVVSEYLRHRFRDKLGKPVRGILYRSAKKPTKKNLALFMTAAEVEGAVSDRWNKKEPLIRLVRVEEFVRGAK